MWGERNENPSYNKAPERKRRMDTAKYGTALTDRGLRGSNRVLQHYMVVPFSWSLSTVYPTYHVAARKHLFWAWEAGKRNVKRANNVKSSITSYPVY